MEDEEEEKEEETRQTWLADIDGRDEEGEMEA